MSAVRSHVKCALFCEIDGSSIKLPTVRENLSIGCTDQRKTPWFLFLNSPPLLGRFPKLPTELDVFGVRRKERGSESEQTHTVRRFSVAVWL